MRILHYSLGLPPYRSGGLTKYATDLMVAQNTKGDIVSLLYPGDFTFWKIPKMKIVKDKEYKCIVVYQIENPSLVPLLHGVRNPIEIYNPKQHLSEKAIKLFYNDVQPEIMHIHTLMGLPLELIVYFKNKGVKIVFTSHDYYGLCPKVNFVNHKNDLCISPSGNNCAICNKTSPSSLFLRLRNSKYILKYKEKFASKIVQKSTVNKNGNEIDDNYLPTDVKIEEYDLLLKLYLDLFDLVDCLHFNSSVSEGVYKSYLHCSKSKVISISHKGINDNRSVKKFEKKKLNIGFIGSVESFKGFPLLREVMLELEAEQYSNWTLKIWGGIAGVDSESNLIQFMGKYGTQDLDTVFDQIELLIVPSICKETFSLITLEALSFGVPVLVTSNVGAKDIVKKYDDSFIVEPTKVALSIKIKSILENNRELIEYNNKINFNPFDFGLDTHIIEIKKLYQTVFKA